MKNKIIIFCVFLCCIIFIGYSKYNESLKVQSNTEIAKPIIEVIRKDENKICVLNNDKYFYEFSVRNFNEKNEVSAVCFKYDIEFVLSQEDAPVRIDLYKINDLDEIKIELENYKTINFEKFGLDKKENLYRAEIKYDENSKNIMSDKLEIDLKVDAVQEVEEKN